MVMRSSSSTCSTSSTCTWQHFRQTQADLSLLVRLTLLTLQVLHCMDNCTVRPYTTSLSIAPTLHQAQSEGEREKKPCVMELGVWEAGHMQISVASPPPQLVSRGARDLSAVTNSAAAAVVATGAPTAAAASASVPSSKLPHNSVLIESCH